jgi:DNA-directed RNA polymerase sigma subunit (sigma70/sigma32)
MSIVATEIQDTFEIILSSLVEKERSVIERRIGLK